MSRRPPLSNNANKSRPGGSRRNSGKANSTGPNTENGVGTSSTHKSTHNEPKTSDTQGTLEELKRVCAMNATAPAMAFPGSMMLPGQAMMSPLAMLAGMRPPMAQLPFAGMGGGPGMGSRFPMFNGPLAPPVGPPPRDPYYWDRPSVPSDLRSDGWFREWEPWKLTNANEKEKPGECVPDPSISVLCKKWEQICRDRREICSDPCKMRQIGITDEQCRVWRDTCIDVRRMCHSCCFEKEGSSTSNQANGNSNTDKGGDDSGNIRAAAAKTQTDKAPQASSGVGVDKSEIQKGPRTVAGVSSEKQAGLSPQDSGIKKAKSTTFGTGSKRADIGK